MSTDLATQSPQGLQAAWTQEEADLIRQHLCPGATDGELRLFAHVAKSRGLSPFSKQIIMQVRQTKQGRRTVFITTIDALRAKAARTGEYAGNDDPIFDNEENPSKATAKVYRRVQGIREEFTASARWSQYCPEPGQDQVWRRMPHVMLGKCAEALALRKAFPEELSDLYVREEMDQANDDAATPVDISTVEKTRAVTEKLAQKGKTVEAQVVPNTHERVARALAAFEGLGVKASEVVAKLKLESIKEITEDHLNSELAGWYDELRTAKEEASVQ